MNTLKNALSQVVVEMSPAEELAKLRAENEALKAQARANEKHGVRISEKGCVAVYGLGRFPTTLYRSQWEKLFERIDTIKQFMVDNKDALDKIDEARIKPEKQVA